ncbi:hypothetical protein C5167_049176 [Papaver somniferum]|uniref:Anaphase-promoting complex subunit 4 WD40 domain-containing protein n=1 Tax=Papaver somniferum TaxID=3469 RepID=A0A4Y7KP89_PAPSO|nr:hypothetical protein C5167_049176 [Papaver somniferum]
MFSCQRVTDMASFAEDVHLLASASIDGRVFVWEIKEGTNEKHKPRITWEMECKSYIKVVWLNASMR